MRTRAVIERFELEIVRRPRLPRIRAVDGRWMENFGVGGTTRKPLLMGEFGAFKGPYGSPADAASALAAWQAASCPYGIDGWLVWTWDTDEQPELWNAQSGGGAIASALAPDFASQSVQGPARVDEPRAGEAGHSVGGGRLGAESSGRQPGHELELRRGSTAMDRDRSPAVGEGRRGEAHGGTVPVRGAYGSPCLDEGSGNRGRVRAPPNAGRDDPRW